MSESPVFVRPGKRFGSGKVAAKRLDSRHLAEWRLLLFTTRIATVK